MPGLMDALKTFNKGTDMWSVPKKNTPVHKTLMRLIKGTPSSVDRTVLGMEAKKPRGERKSMNIRI